MTNEILYKRICKLIAMNYALNEDLVWKVYNKVNSIDQVLEVIQNGKITEIIS